MCDKCGKTLPHKEHSCNVVNDPPQYVKPKKIKSKKNEQMCSLCNKTFYDKSTLKRHIQTIHEVNIRSTVVLQNIKLKKYKKQDLLCNLCAIRFRHKWNYSRHMKNFHLKSSRVIHNKTSFMILSQGEHISRQGRRCRQCSMSFEEVKDFRSHMKENHTQEHTCQICLKNIRVK